MSNELCAHKFQCMDWATVNVCKTGARTAKAQRENGLTRQNTTSKHIQKMNKYVQQIKSNQIFVHDQK